MALPAAVVTLRVHDLPRFRSRDLLMVISPVSTGSAPCERSDPETADRMVHAVNGRMDVVTPDDEAPPGPALQFGFDAGRRRMTVHGDIDFANGAALADAMVTLFDRDLGTIVVDVGQLNFADAASLSLFLASCNALCDEGVQLRVVGATPIARRAFDAAGLDALLADE